MIIFVTRTKHVNVVETHHSAESTEELLPTKQFQETQCSALSSYMTTHHGKEFTNLLKWYNGMVEGSFSKAQYMDHNFMYLTCNLSDQSQTIIKWVIILL